MMVLATATLQDLKNIGYLFQFFFLLKLKQTIACLVSSGSTRCPSKSSRGWSMSTLTCTLSVWQGQLAGNGTMELDSKTGAEYLKTYDTRKNTKSNQQR